MKIIKKFFLKNRAQAHLLLHSLPLLPFACFLCTRALHIIQAPQDFLIFCKNLVFILFFSFHHFPGVGSGKRASIHVLQAQKTAGPYFLIEQTPVGKEDSMEQSSLRLLNGFERI